MPRKNSHFEVVQEGRYWRSVCLHCLENSPPYISRYKATKWQPIHARAEIEDFDPIIVARDLAQYGIYPDE